MRVRGTPFIAAVIMSAAAMFLIPQAVKERDRTHTPTASSNSALPAAGPSTSDSPSASATQSAPPPAVMTGPAAAGAARSLHAAPVNLSVKGFWSWALFDRRTGELVGSDNMAARSDTASMIKAWIAADYLRRASEKGTTVSDSVKRELSIMIRDSNNEMASKYHRINGSSASINRMIQICGLTDSRAVSKGSWSTTEISARDGTRIAVCLSSGKAAGPQHTPWVLSEMRQVRGVGRFGPIQAFAPDVAKTVAIKNGWVTRSADGKWHIACLAVSDEWALTVLVQHSASLGMNYGANVCKQVAVQLSVA